MAIRVRKLAKEVRRSAGEVLGLLHHLGYVNYKRPDDMVADGPADKLRRAVRQGQTAAPLKVVDRKKATVSPSQAPASDLMAQLVPGVVKQGQAAPPVAPSRPVPAPRPAPSPPPVPPRPASVPVVDPAVAVERDAIEVALFAEIHPVRESVRIERNRLGLPKKTARAGLEDRFTPYIAVDLLLKDEPRALRLRSSAFDFPALLGDDVQIAATLNMRTIIERVSPPGRAIEVDTGFRRVHVLPAPQEREEQGGMKAGVVPRRAVDFTEYSLLRGMGLHPG